MIILGRTTRHESRMADLEGQNAVITGGARGIGFSIAEQLLETGVSKVLILDLGEQLDPAKQTNLMTCNPKAEVFYSQCDITDTQRLEKVLRQDAVQWMGSIDIFINCAGIVDENNPARCIATNLTALINCSMIAFDLMSKEKQGRGGTIVNISSLAGLEGFLCLAVYSASKSGVIGFTKSVGVEPVFKLTGVKVVAVCPGATETEMFSDSSEIELSFPALRPIIEQVIENMPIQKPIAVGRTVVKAITKGKTGSIWISVNDGFTEVKPNSNKYKWMMLFFSLKKFCCCIK